MRNKISTLALLALLTNLTACGGGSGSDILPELPNIENPSTGGGVETDKPSEGDQENPDENLPPEIEEPDEDKPLTFDDIFPNKDALAGMTENDYSMFLSVKDAEGDNPETLVISGNGIIVNEISQDGLLEFPINTFEDKGSFYYSNIDKPSEQSKYAFVMIPKDVNLSYSTFYGLGSESINSGRLSFTPIYQYNNDYKMDIASIDETMTFSGKSLLGVTSISKDNSYSYRQTAGDANLTINPRVGYDLTMNFDDFYTINYDINMEEQTFSFSNGNNVSSEWEDKLSFIQEGKPYDIDGINNSIDFILLGDGKPQEILSEFRNLIYDDDNNYISITGGFAATRK